jgi:hypothetical protein
MIQAVITGDIVNSTSLKETDEKKLAAALKQVFDQQKMEFFGAIVFRCMSKSLSKPLGWH